ncbi:hypothetical protein E2I21_04050 [Alcaligenaceae bacterium SAGV5]|nr:hypothetical protein [Alcaligenaceae bacterium SAGV5]
MQSRPPDLGAAQRRRSGPPVPARALSPCPDDRPQPGLGLAISAGIVRDFGGSLRAYNREGGGAEFVLQLRPAKLEETVDA